MSNFTKSVGSISSERAQLVDLLLKRKGISVPQQQGIQRRSETDTCVLSFAQQRLWFIDQLEGANPVYNIPESLHLLGQFAVPAFEQALNQVIARHEVLRTSFESRDGQPVQVIAPSLELRLKLVDLTRHPEAEREIVARRLAAEEARRPFNLTKGPLLRAHLLRVREDDHLLLLTLHHIIFDGWSMRVLVGEIAELYEFYRTGKRSALADLPVQYADFAIWQRAFLSGKIMQEQVDYWKRQLGNSPMLLQLPTDRPRSKVQTYRGASQSFSIPSELVARIKAVADAHEATLFMTLLAAYVAVLYRYSGQQEILVGTPIANRSSRETEALIGFFANTLVIKADLTGNPTFSELLRRIRKAALEAYGHQDLPFEKLVEELQPERSLAFSPIFQVMFVLQNTPREAARLPELRLRPLGFDKTTAKFDLNLSVSEAGSVLVGDLEYSRDLFEAATIKRLLGHWRQLLAAASLKPAEAVGRLAMLRASERQQLLVEVNDTAADYTADGTLVAMVARQVAQQADTVAVVYGEAQVSYGALNEAADRLAAQLLAAPPAGVQRPGAAAAAATAAAAVTEVAEAAPVAICCGRGLNMAVAVLGVLKAGLPYLPIEASLPAARQLLMCRDAGVAVLIGEAGVAEGLREAGLHRLELNQSGQVIAASQKLSEEDAASRTPAAETVAATCGSLTVAPPEQALGYVIYTSGSTGQPKGIGLPLAALTNLISWHLRALPGRRRWLQFASLGFDASFHEMLACWASGGSLFILDPETRLDGERLAGYIAEREIERAILPVVVLQQLAEALAGQGEAGRTLREVITTGEAMQITRAVEELFARQEWSQLVNHYGPSETHVVTSYELEGEPSEWERQPSIGRAIANTQVYVLDEEKEAVAVGVAGELYIGGVMVGRGYVGRADLTAARFVPAVGGEAGGRMYATGDVVRQDEKGRLRYEGRRDEQVKVRGNRVEMGEVEAALVRRRGVKEAVVVARGEGMEKRLVGYVVWESEEGEGEVEREARVREELRQELPEYMVPGMVVGLERLPLTRNGKVDKRALPAPSEAEMARPSYDPPRSPAEEIIANIWSDVLKRTPIGTHTNFFDLGGHSLLATQVVSRIRKAFGIDLALRSLFERSTVAGLAELVEQGLKAGEGLQEMAISPTPREGPLPLSFAQQRLWFLDQMSPGESAFNLPSAVRLKGELCIAALEATLSEILRRHEVLRTYFPSLNGEPVQVVAEPTAVAVPLIDLEHLTEPCRSRQVAKLIREESSNSFDLKHGLMLRARLLRLAADDHVVLLTLHHIAGDGWSIGVLVREIATLYGHFSKGLNSPLAELSIQYADFAVWQREWMAGQELQRQLDYWKTALGATPSDFELPGDRPRPAVQTFHGQSYRLFIDKNLSEKIEGLCRSEGATLFMALLSAFDALLYRYTGVGGVAVGTAIANRNRTEIEDLIGFFINTLVFKAEVTGSMTALELLRQIRNLSFGAYSHQDLPFEKLVDELQPKRDLSRSPLFQVMFILQNAPADAMDLPGMTMSMVEASNQTAKYDLTLVVTATPDGLLAIFEYNTDIYNRVTIERLAGHFRTLIESLVANPNQRIADLTLLSLPERHQAMVEANDTARPFATSACIHQLIEAQVEATPDAVALVFAETALTYREVNRRANQFAHYLLELGVQPDQAVGLCMDRSAEMVLALLAILKAGGAYLPIDPSYPEERLAYMMSDSKMALLVTDRRLLGKVSGLAAAAVCLDPADAALTQRRRDNPRVRVAPQNLAYMIYTSGSTGTPKGVQISHRSAVNLFEWVRRQPGLTPQDRLLATTTLSFDIATVEVCLPLICGARLEVISRDVAVDPAALDERLRQTQATVIQATPATWRMLLESGWEGRPGLKIFCAGEALTAELAAYILEHCGSLWNLYGPTETAIYSAGCQVQDTSGPIPIGRPVANTQIYLLDSHLNLTPLGVPGELYIGGDGLARGYWNKPDLTVERFAPNPFSASGGLIYRTGDVARRLDDGSIEYLGRTDHQVKLRGFRIELGEIETSLRRHPAISDAVVGVSKDAGLPRLVAYLTVIPDAAPNASELRAFLKSSLPEYMIPAAFITLDALPLTPNGKVDRKALPALTEGRPELQQGFVAPTTGVERAMAQVWAQVLRVDRVGIQDSFFELGGDSILVIQAVVRCNQAGIAITPRHVFQHQTIAELARAVTQAGLDRQAAQTGDTIPLMPAQKDFFEGRDGQRHFDTRWLLLEAAEPLDTARLGAALAQLAARHEALRFRFTPSAGGWVQAITDAAAVSLSQRRFTDLPPGGREAALAEERANLESMIDLTQGPLMVAGLYDFGDGPRTLLLAAHRLAVDTTSLRVIRNDLQSLYAGAGGDEETASASAPTPISRWARSAHQYAASEALAGERAFWLAQMSARAEPLPVDFSGGANRCEFRRSVAVGLDAAESETLRSVITAASRAHLREILLTAILDALTWWTAQRAFVIEMESDARRAAFDSLDVARTVGPMNCCYPVMLEAGSAADLADLLKSVKEQLRRVPGAGVGFGLLDPADAGLKLPGDAIQPPGAEIWFSFNEPPARESSGRAALAIADESPSLPVGRRGDRRHVLEITGHLSGEKLQFQWTYSETLHRRETVERLAQRFVSTLRAMVAQGGSFSSGNLTPVDFPQARVSQKDLEKLLTKLNRTEQRKTK